MSIDPEDKDKPKQHFHATVDFPPLDRIQFGLLRSKLNSHYPDHTLNVNPNGIGVSLGFVPEDQLSKVQGFIGGLTKALGIDFESRTAPAAQTARTAPEPAAAPRNPLLDHLVAKANLPENMLWSNSDTTPARTSTPPRPESPGTPRK